MGIGDTLIVCEAKTLESRFVCTCTYNTWLSTSAVDGYLVVYLVQQWPLYSAGLLCASQQYGHCSGNRHYLLRTLPHWWLVTPMCPKRFHRPYERATVITQPVL